jgi:TetR/AcrR family transcriptional regulator, transcriptional repressor for nem operon
MDAMLTRTERLVMHSAIADAQKGTRERLIETAAQLFWEQGYHATGLAQIYEQAQVRSGSFYHFFASKDAVLRAVLEYYHASFFSAVVAPNCTKEPDPIERVFCLLGEYRKWILRTQFRFGCPVGRLAMEMDPEFEEVFAGIRDNFSMWAATVEAWLKEAGTRLPKDPDLGKIATFVLTVMEGGVMQARAAQSIEPFDDSIAVLRHFFDSLLTQTKTKSKTTRKK